MSVHLGAFSNLIIGFCDLQNSDEISKGCDSFHGLSICREYIFTNNEREREGWGTITHLKSVRSTVEDTVLFMYIVAASSSSSLLCLVRIFYIGDLVEWDI